MSLELSVEIKNVSISYDVVRGWSRKKVSVLEDVNLVLEKGSWYCLFGPSGCGKSSLAKAIAGLITDYSGEIIVLGKDLKDWFSSSGERRRFYSKVQMVFQNAASSMHPFMRIESILSEAVHLKYGRIAKNRKRKILYNWMEKFDMPLEFLKRFPFQLSGGQRQRIMLMRSLIVSPELLILDEFDVGLDSDTKKQVFRIIENQMSEKTLLFISHNLETAVQMAEWIILMKAGRIVNILNKDTFYNNYSQMWHNRRDEGLAR